MNSFKSLLIFTLCICGCSAARKISNINVCDKAYALQLAEHKMKAVHHETDLEKYMVTEIIDSNNYCFEFTKNDLRHPGGGGMFKVNKKDCKMKYELYQ